MASIGKFQGDPRHYGEKLSAYALSLGIRSSIPEAIRPVHGISEGGKITLLPDLSSPEHAAVLAHELAHENSPSPASPRGHVKTIRETEAEAVAFVVCQAVRTRNRFGRAGLHPAPSGRCETAARKSQLLRLVAGRILDGILENQTLLEVRAA